MGEYFNNKMTSIDLMQSGLFTDRVKIFLHKPPKLRNKMFISPIIRVKEIPTVETACSIYLC